MHFFYNNTSFIHSRRFFLCNILRCAAFALVAGCLVIGGFTGCAESTGLSYEKTWTIPDVDLEMVPIRAGSFRMGSPENEADRESREKRFQVKITKPFWLGKFPVTQGQWEFVMGKNPSSFKQVGKDAPVEMVSWFDAMEFCDKLTEQERVAGRLPAGYRYTLPTEAQWEYACRAGTTTPFNTGDNLTSKQANYDGNRPFREEDKGEFRGKTTKVGSFLPNAWGLYDMHGNVWEWCADWFDEYPLYPFYPLGNLTDPSGPSMGDFRVLRGGSWHTDASRCRSAYRGLDSPGFWNKATGFRLALVPVR